MIYVTFLSPSIQIRKTEINFYRNIGDLFCLGSTRAKKKKKAVCKVNYKDFHLLKESQMFLSYHAKTILIFMSMQDEKNHWLLAAESMFRSGSLHASAGLQVNHLQTIQVYLRPAIKARGCLHISASLSTTMQKYQLLTDSTGDTVVDNADTKQVTTPSNVLDWHLLSGKTTPSSS